MPSPGLSGLSGELGCCNDDATADAAFARMEQSPLHEVEIFGQQLVLIGAPVLQVFNGFRNCALLHLLAPRAAASIRFRTSAMRSS
ncbi:protein of unknown function [Methylorubrum extorquens]|uniref:Uncharacterized protein n=1 Tax=Methylorubrum extorquens TaxID=408 RepID=A0A2N9AXG9_METEX|nr:protein of unknown function [Methylorubrum extorquens]